MIDDSYNASPASVMAAFDLLESPAFASRRKLVFLGDMLDLGAAFRGWHLALCEPLRALRNVQLFLFGDAMCEVHQALGDLQNVVILGILIGLCIWVWRKQSDARLSAICDQALDIGGEVTA